jgi:uncharacterized repeat protein (TIGR03803 family)
MPRQDSSVPVFLFVRLTLMAAMFLPSVFAFGQTETILHDFIALPHGAVPEASVIADSAGNLYGTTTDGGLYGFGTVFKLSPASGSKWTQTVLYNFTNASDGSYPTAGLIFDGAGNLYGTTTTGGAFCLSFSCDGVDGTVFELSPNSDGTWSETTLYSFGATGDGSDPVAGVVFDKNGNLYGTTYYGGFENWGTVFELSPSSSGWTETILLKFTDEQDGGNPLGGVTLDSAGNVYGTASVGGDVNCDNFSYQPWGCGAVFELTNSNGTWSETVLHSFAITDGAFPNAGLTFDAAGDLVGTTVGGPGPNCGLGCGTVFELKPGTSGTWTFKTVYTFAGGTDGAIPKSALVLGADGNFYGTTSQGGDANDCEYGCGTVFSLTPTTSIWKEKLLHHFSGSASNPAGVDGEYPLAAITFDQFGNMYGTAQSGGSASAVAQCNAVSRCGGTVYELSKNSSGQWITLLLYSFTASGDGLSPTAGLVADGLGNLYGATQNGGAHGYGSIYELMPQSAGGYKERVLYSFLGGSGGSQPIGGLIFDASGNLYGATNSGGSNSQCTNTGGCGTIFELSPAAGGKSTLQTLHAFSDTDGVEINTPLAFDSNGNLLGTTSGGNNGLSTAFELSPSSGGWNFSVLHTFTNNDVFSPGGAVIIGSSGNWFGVGEGGNHGAGVVYELSPGTSGYTTTVLHTFAGAADGAYPAAPLVNHNGVLIGVTYEGGSSTGSCLTYGCGTVFAVAHSGSNWQKKTIYTFTGGTDASNPAYGLTADSSGNLYGTSWAGGGPNDCRDGNGSGGCGVIYKLTESAGQWTESVLYDFGVTPYDIYDPNTLLWTSSNLLFGTGNGGEDGNGAVYQIDLNQAPRSLGPLPARPHLRSPSPHPPLVPVQQLKSGKGGN